ncbi:MAG TPA: DUF6503 family protein [Chryseosolibacter sp.]
MTEVKLIPGRENRSRAGRLFILLLLPTLYGCGDRTADRVVASSIEQHGGKAFESVFVEFDFRNRHYTATRDKGLFTYTREFSDTTGRVRDVLTNTAFVRYRNDTIVPISDERKNAFTNSVNSVIYFALLPYFLEDKAVNKRFVGETTIKGQPYRLVRVTFDKRGGGQDHEDVYLFWFHRENKTMDYFAYSYQTDRGGLRFRRAINPRNVGGILFQDYINYHPLRDGATLEQLQALFERGELGKLSDITLENIHVRHLKDVKN